MLDPKRRVSLRRLLELRVKAWKDAGRGRSPFLLEQPGEGPRAHLGSRTLINFLSNDSLGQTCDPDWRRIVGECFSRYPASGTASRLAGGHWKLAAEAEQAFAEHFGHAECLFFPSGYQANLAWVTGLLHAGQQVFADRRIHASIARAIPLSGAELRTWAHADNEHLNRRLASTADPETQPLVVTESLFSMDGTVADLENLAALRQEHGFFLVLDEAHAVGALGPGGRGLAASRPGTADVVVGTFGKALGFFGAFLLLPRGFVSILEHLSSSVMHSTALPPAHAAAVLRLVERLPQLDAERTRLAANADLFREALRQRRVSWRGTAHIVAVPSGEAERTALLGARLRERGVLALAARYPTVPHGDGLLRFNITSLHTPEMLEEAAEAVAAVLKEEPSGPERKPIP